MPYTILNREASKIKQLHGEIPKIREKHQKILEIYDSNMTFFPQPHLTYYIMGFACILALIFDFWVSKQTMAPIARIPKIRPELIALIFNLLDALVAILASGVLAKTMIDKVKQKNIWRPILWALCLVKIVLFITTTTVVLKGSVSILGTIIIVGLAILVYVILDLAGSGLLFLYLKAKRWIQIDKDPDKMLTQLDTLKHEFIKKCSLYKLDLKEAINFHGLNHIMGQN